MLEELLSKAGIKVVVVDSETHDNGDSTISINDQKFTVHKNERPLASLNDDGMDAASVLLAMLIMNQTSGLNTMFFSNDSMEKFNNSYSTFVLAATVLDNGLNIRLVPVSDA